MMGGRQRVSHAIRPAVRRVRSGRSVRVAATRMDAQQDDEEKKRMIALEDEIRDNTGAISYVFPRPVRAHACACARESILPFVIQYMYALKSSLLQKCPHKNKALLRNRPKFIIVSFANSDL